MLNSYLTFYNEAEIRVKELSLKIAFSVKICSLLRINKKINREIKVLTNVTKKAMFSISLKFAFSKQIDKIK